MAISKITSSGLAGDKYNVMTAGNNYYEPLASTLLTTTSTGVTFADIPQTYKHLQIRATVVGTAGNDILSRINGDTAANYSFHYLATAGTTPSAGSGASTTYIAQGNNFLQGSTMPSLAIIDILDYANTNKNKVTRVLSGSDGSTVGYIQLGSGCWRSTAAITSILLYPGGGTFAANSRFSLYGLKG